MHAFAEGPRTEVQSSEAQVHAAAATAGTVAVMVERVGGAFLGNSSETRMRGNAVQYIEDSYLVGGVVSQEGVYACKRVSDGYSAFYAAFLTDNIEELLECTFKG